MAFGDSNKTGGTSAGSGPATIREAIAEKLQDLGGYVEDQVIETFANREVNKRAQAVVNVIDQIMKMESDLRKLKPDVIAYDENGTIVRSDWSKTKFDEKKKLTEKIEKYARAVNNAIEKGDYGDVYNLGSGKDTGQNRGGDSAEAD